MTMIPAKHHDGEGKGKREKGRKEEMNRREWKVSLGEGRLTNDCDAQLEQGCRLAEADPAKTCNAHPIV